MKFTNLLEVTKYFESQENCLNYLTQMRWPTRAITCTFCKHDKVYILKGKNKRYKCAKCRKQFSAIKGTIFENSQVPLQKWFMAVYILSSHKKGVSSVQLASDLGVTQKTAWFMAQRIRYALKIKIPKTQLKGVIQVDESFIGGKNKNRHAHKKVIESQGRSIKDKQPVLGMIAHGGDLHTEVIPDTKAVTIKPIIKTMVREGSIVVTDEWHGYAGTSQAYSHVVINHKKGEYVRGAFDTNSIEGFWSLLKRGIYGIYHQVSKKHLHRYLDEFSFRYNSRRIGNDVRFGVATQRVECRLSYKELIHKG